MRRFERISEGFLKYERKEIILPFRATINSAGYDFFSPIDVVIPPNQVQIVWTNVKVQLNSKEVLMLFVTSKIGKNKVMLANGTGIIDADYYSNKDNDGNIGFMLYNFGTTDYIVQANDKIGQGIITEFLTVDDEKEISEKRIGGFGSTVR